MPPATAAVPPADLDALLELGSAHGLDLDGSTLHTEEIGLDFRVAIARAADGKHWVLRIPRRPDVLERAAVEGRLLKMVGPHLGIAVPDWQISTSELIAYPLLPGARRAGWHSDLACRHVFSRLRHLARNRRIPAACGGYRGGRCHRYRGALTQAGA
ncbi:MAG: hypothetical protein ACTMII_07250 [Brachybacterium sp.]